jgi:hypothetical protein
MEISVGRVNVDKKDYVNIVIDRTTNLGNQFSNGTRDENCDDFQEWFDFAIDKTSPVYNTSGARAMRERLMHIVRLLSEGKNINLQCWCVPKRCHGHTYQAWLLGQNIKARDSVKTMHPDYPYLPSGVVEKYEDDPSYLEHLNEKARSTKPVFRVVVAGGREFSWLGLMCKSLDHALQRKKLTHDIVIVSGKARGADSLGEKYAELRGYKVEEYHADWDLHGKSAGYKRNAQMAEVADAVVAFWDGKSRGTQHMIDLAKKKGCIVKVVRYDT